MRLNFFSRNADPEPQHASEPPPPMPVEPPPAPVEPPPAPADRPATGKTFPADEVVWGIAIRNGFDELDDPWYHRGTTQHAFLEGSDAVAICGFRPPQSGPRTRRRARLGLPTSGEHPMCGMCARMVVAPRPRVPVPVQTGRPPVAIPVQNGGAPVQNGSAPVQNGGAPVGAPVPAGVAPRPLPAAAPPPNGATPAGVPVAIPPAPSQSTSSPWVQQRSQQDVQPAHTVEIHGSHDTGLMERGVHATPEE